MAEPMSSRVKSALQRFDLRDRATQVAVASIGLVVLLLAVILVWPSGSDQQGTVRTSDDRSASVTDIAGEETEEEVDGSSDEDTEPTTSSESSAVASAPEEPGDGGEPAAAPITDKEVKVGIAYLEDPGSANAAAGFGGIGQVDQKRAWQAMIDEVNADAPLGRKLVPVWYSFTNDDVQSKGSERLSQEMCAHFTQDNRVSLVWGAGDDTLHSCLTKAKVPEIGGGGGLAWSKTYRDFPYFLSPATAALDRMAEFQVDQLHAQGFFDGFKQNEAPYDPRPPADGKPRIGLIRYDQPSYKAAAQAMKDRLAAHGLALCDGCEFEIGYSADNVAQQLDDSTEVNAAIQNCKGRPDGPCTHMLFLGSTAGGRITLFFVDGAERQGYRPRLGLNPLDIPNVVKDFLGSLSYPQWRDSMIVTWDPNTSFGRPTQRHAACKKIFEDAGETFEGDEASNKLAQIAGYCDTAWYTSAVLERVDRPLSASSFVAAAETIPAVSGASTYRMQTKAGRHDGAGAIRIGGWFDDCECFKPTSDIIPV